MSPHDRKAVVAWAEYHDEAKEVAQTLAELEPGESWILSPGFLRSMQRIRWRRRRTFDSGATPKTGSKPRVPVSLADIDLGEIKERMADTLERAKADDPKELRKRIAQLEKEIAGHKCPDAIAQHVEVPIVSDDDRQVLQASVEQIHTSAADLGEVAHHLLKVMNEGRTVGVGWDKPQPAEEKRSPRPTRLATGGIVKNLPLVSEANPESPESEVTIGKGEQKVLAVLAQWPQGRTYNELAFLAGYSSKASTLGVILGKLRKLGYATVGQPVKLTPEGLEAAGGAQPLPSGPELLEHWRSHPRMGEGERRVLDVLIEAYPDELSHAELCEEAGYSPNASTVGVILGKLRKLGLVEKGARKATDEFMESIR